MWSRYQGLWRGKRCFSLSSRCRCWWISPWRRVVSMLQSTSQTRCRWWRFDRFIRWNRFRDDIRWHGSWWTSTKRSTWACWEPSWSCSTFGPKDPILSGWQPHLLEFLQLLPRTRGSPVGHVGASISRSNAPINMRLGRCAQDVLFVFPMWQRSSMWVLTGVWDQTHKCWLWRSTSCSRSTRSPRSTRRSCRARSCMEVQGRAMVSTGQGRLTTSIKASEPMGKALMRNRPVPTAVRSTSAPPTPSATPMSMASQSLAFGYPNGEETDESWQQVQDEMALQQAVSKSRPPVPNPKAKAKAAASQGAWWLRLDLCGNLSRSWGVVFAPLGIAWKRVSLAHTTTIPALRLALRMMMLFMSHDTRLGDLHSLWSLLMVEIAEQEVNLVEIVEMEVNLVDTFEKEVLAVPWHLMWLRSWLSVLRWLVQQLCSPWMRCFRLCHRSWMWWRLPVPLILPWHQPLRMLVSIANGSTIRLALTWTGKLVLWSFEKSLVFDALDLFGCLCRALGWLHCRTWRPGLSFNG